MGGGHSRKCKSRPNKAEPRRPRGVTTGLSIQDAWVHVFERNAKARKCDRMTDDEIGAFMVGEFPGYTSVVFHKVQIVRTRYNRGGLTRGVVPAKESVRYDENGDPNPPKVGRPVGAFGVKRRAANVQAAQGGRRKFKVRKRRA